MDTDRLKRSFGLVAAHGGDEVVLYFYSRLFASAPEARALFPVAMTAQRDRLLNALVRIVSQVDDLDALVPFLRGLGRDHRKFGAQPAHYALVGAALLATLEHFAGDAWTPELAADWAGAYALAAKVMTEAAEEDEQRHPAWWDGEVVSAQRRGTDVTVLRVAVKPELAWAPGQSVSVQCDAIPRVWRYLSPANVPRPDGSADFHVRAVDGGLLSTYLVRQARPGLQLRLGPPVGALALDISSPRDVMLLAGSSGLAPLLAICEQVAAANGSLRQSYDELAGQGAVAPACRVHLIFGARWSQDLYARHELGGMAAAWPWLSVTYAVSDDPRPPSPDTGPYERGTVAEVASRESFSGRDVYVCGSPGMVRSVTQMLAGRGVPSGQVHAEDFS
jgi:NAD(P)H-flavin reductase/hemoglobin-like flavoprotein